jgi:hypothetical protein
MGILFMHFFFCSRAKSELGPPKSSSSLSTRTAGETRPSLCGGGVMQATVDILCLGHSASSCFFDQHPITTHREGS